MKRTIITQGHLSPFSLNALPVHWDFDYCLRLYPLPDLIVVGDKSEAYQGSYKDCSIVNPVSLVLYIISIYLAYVRCQGMK